MQCALIYAIGKGWAKGLTAGTDRRVAAAAAAHRGLRYRRLSAQTDLRKLAGDPVAPDWSGGMAYVVGLIATDGCLLSGRRRIHFKSADRELVALYLRLLRRSNTIATERTRQGGIAYKTQIADAALYDWLIGIGLTPRKSLTMGPLAVPDEFVVDLARGLFDGDGTIINKVYRADTRGSRPYLHEYLITRFYSASRPHLDWLDVRLRESVGVQGWLGHVGRTTAGNHMWTLAFAKRGSEKLLAALYHDPLAPCLQRKRDIWNDYVRRQRALEWASPAQVV